MEEFQKFYNNGGSLPKEVVCGKEYGFFFKVDSIGELCDKYLIEEIEGTPCFKVHRYTEGSDALQNVIPGSACAVSIMTYGDSIFVVQSRFADFSVYIHGIRLYDTFVDVTWIPLISSFGLLVLTDLSGKTSVVGYRYDNNVGLITCFPEKRSELQKWFKKQAKIAYEQYSLGDIPLRVYFDVLGCMRCIDFSETQYKKATME